MAVGHSQMGRGIRCPVGQTEHALHQKTPRWREWTRWTESAMREHERGTEAVGLLMIIATAHKIGEDRKRATRAAARMTATITDLSMTLERHMSGIRRKCKEQADTLRATQKESTTRNRLAGQEAEDREAIEARMDAGKRDAEGRHMVRKSRASRNPDPGRGTSPR